MALTFETVGPIETSLHGILLTLWPALDAVTGLPMPGAVEVRRAPDSSGSPGTPETIARLDSLPARGAIFIDPRPSSTAIWWYSHRHVMADAAIGGAWSDWMSATVELITPERQAEALAGNLVDDTVAREKPFTDRKHALQATESDGRTKVTTAFNDNGCVLPFISPQPGTFFNYDTGGVGSGQMWVSFGWSTQTLRRPDGTTFSAPAPPSAPSAPTLTDVVAGALGARTLFARIAYAKTDGTVYNLYPVSAESSRAVPANSVLKITSPSNPGGGLYDGWVALVGSATNAEYVQGANDPLNIVPFGTDWTEPTTGFSTTQNSQWTSSWRSLTVTGLIPNTQHFFYHFLDLAVNQVRVRTSSTSRSDSHAQKQNGDGIISLGQYGSAQGYSGAAPITTPAAAGSANGTVGGGRLN